MRFEPPYLGLSGEGKQGLRQRRDKEQMVTEHGAVSQSLQVELNWSIINLEGLAHPFTEIVIKLSNH